jgi:hypothetical protein
MKKVVYFLILLNASIFASKIQELTPEEHAKIIAFIIRAKL